MSDTFNSDGDIEVKVTMLNINYGKNKKLMDSCRPLNEYAWLVDTIRRYQKNLMNLEAAVDAAINEMPDDFIIKKFLLSNKAEVKGMFLTEYNQERVLEQERKLGINQANERVATDMLRDGKPLHEIQKYSKLAEDVILKLANKLKISTF